jgi:hypothetical protein
MTCLQLSTPPPGTPDLEPRTCCGGVTSGPSEMNHMHTLKQNESPLVVNFFNVLLKCVGPRTLSLHSAIFSPRPTSQPLKHGYLICSLNSSRFFSLPMTFASAHNCHWLDLVPLKDIQIYFPFPRQTDHRDHSSGRTFVSGLAPPMNTIRVTHQRFHGNYCSISFSFYFYARFPGNDGRDDAWRDLLVFVISRQHNSTTCTTERRRRVAFAVF